MKHYKTPIIKNCIICNTKIETYPSLKNKKYCSKACQSISLKGNNNATGHKFPNYHKNIEKMNKVNKGNKYTLGYKHTDKTKKRIKETSTERWKDGNYRLEVVKKIREGLVQHYTKINGPHAASLKSTIRASFQYEDWRKEVFVRDNYTCQDCGASGCHLEAHHKMAFVAIVKKFNIKTFEEALCCVKLWDVNNGKTLCDKCHDKTKRVYNYTHFGGEPISVYLSGYINEKKLEDCIKWRRQIIEHYNNWNDGEGYPIVWLDPMNGEVGKIENHGMSSSMVPGKALLMRDFNSVKMADIIVANLDTFGGKRPMIGTMFELAWAWQQGTPIIIIAKDNYYINHPFIKEIASMTVSSTEELLQKKFLNYMFKGLVTAE
jgi:5-methylcytosine-specific restriction endonuclease McrA/endogenous inhibitor of DNA gyrase (YacG/DUF329 family)